MALFRSRGTKRDTIRHTHAEGTVDPTLFRRSRTITGTQSQTVQTAGQAHAALRSPRLHVHELRHHRRRLVSLLVVIVLSAATLLWMLDHLIVTPTIVIHDAGSDTEQLTAGYAAAIDHYFASHATERVDTATSLARLQTTLQQTYPETASVTLTNDAGLTKHTITISLRQPIARWQIGDKTYFVDQYGVRFQSLHGHAMPQLTVKDESGLPTATQQIASQSLMRFIGQTIGDIEKRHAFTVEQVILPAATLRQIDLMLKDRPYRIKLSLDRDVAQQVSDMVQALAYIDGHSLQPQYVDIRVEGKAYYRDKD